MNDFNETLSEDVLSTLDPWIIEEKRAQGELRPDELKFISTGLAVAAETFEITAKHLEDRGDDAATIRIIRRTVRMLREKIEKVDRMADKHVTLVELPF